MQLDFNSLRFWNDSFNHFVVPRERVGEARDELMRMLAEDELREAVRLFLFSSSSMFMFMFMITISALHNIIFQVLLIFANKQDLPNAMNAAEITDKLGLHSLRNRNWYIQVRRIHWSRKHRRQKS